MTTPAHGTAPRTRDPLLLSLACAGLAAALCVRIEAPLWGAMETQAAAQALPARNHLRYGFSVTKGLASFAPGGLEKADLQRHWWVNHPPLAPLWTTLFFATLGESTVSIRLSAIVVVIATLPVFWALGRKIAGPAAGWWAVLLYGTAGLTLWEGRRPEYFQPALLLMASGLLFYLKWTERPREHLWACVLAAVALGCWVDWMGYTFGLALATHLIWTGRRRHLVRALVLTAILPLCFGAFLVHAAWVAGEETVSQLSRTFVERATDASRLRAVAVQAQACATHVGVVHCILALAAFSWPGLFPPPFKSIAWLLAGFGLFSSQLFLYWTAYHSYVAAWFLYPCLVLAGAAGASPLTERLSRPSLRIGLTATLGLLAAIQGAAVTAFRHRQDTWYLPEREFASVLKNAVPPRSWVATPIKGLYWPALIYETDCNIFWDVSRREEIEELLKRRDRIHFLVPKQEAADGFWACLSPATRERLGIRRPDPAAINAASRKDLGAYELHTISRTP